MNAMLGTIFHTWTLWIESYLDMYILAWTEAANTKSKLFSDNSDCSLIAGGAEWYVKHMEIIFYQRSIVMTNEI